MFIQLRPYVQERSSLLSSLWWNNSTQSLCNCVVHDDISFLLKRLQKEQIPLPSVWLSFLCQKGSRCALLSSIFTFMPSSLCRNFLISLDAPDLSWYNYSKERSIIAVFIYVDLFGMTDFIALLFNIPPNSRGLAAPALHYWGTNSLKLMVEIQFSDTAIRQIRFLEILRTYQTLLMSFLYHAWTCLSLYLFQVINALFSMCCNRFQAFELFKTEE